MSEEEKKELQENKTLVQSAKDFMSGVLSPLKGKDVGQLVEEFSAEMTLVAEGLSEDQEKLRRDQESLQAQQTLMEQNLLDQLHDARVSLEELQKQADALRRRLDQAEKKAGDKKSKAGLIDLLRQATWLAGIVMGGWIIVTLIRALIK